MSYEAIGSGSITLNAVSADEQKNLQATLLARYDRLRTADLARCGDAMAYQIEREYQERSQAMLKYNDPFWWLTVVFKEVGFSEVDRNPGDGPLSVELSYHNNYYEDMILELLNTLVPFTAEGFISYRGEEGDLWCHVFTGGGWAERSGSICYDEPLPHFQKTKCNLARLIEEIRRQVIYDDRQYEEKAHALLKAFEEHDPDGILRALSGRCLHEHGVAAGIWQDGRESSHPDEVE